MLHSIRKNLFHLSSSCRNVIPPHGYFYSNISIKFVSSYTFKDPSPEPISQPSFTLSYLINSCGFSPAEAVSASKQIQLKTAKKPDSVLTFLRDNGLTQTQIRKAIIKRPTLLLAKPEHTLLPKWEFFHRLGLSDPQLAALFSANPRLLQFSLEKRIIPVINFLETILHDPQDLFSALKFLTYLGQEKEYYSKIKALQNLSVPKSSISKLLATRPSALRQSPERLKEVVEEVKKMGLDPSRLAFIRAVGVMSFTSKSTWERKLALYRSLGWADTEIVTAFTKQPSIMGLSDENIKKKMNFFVNELGWTPAFLSTSPLLLVLSLEKRIIPRLSVLNVLMSRGMFKRNARVHSLLGMAHIKFIENYVTKFEEKVPDVVKAFKGEIEFIVGRWNLEKAV